MTREELFEKARLLPATPGVYIMKNKSGRIIYVGKSKALKNRVSSYFSPYSDHRGKTKRMVESVNDFEVYYTLTELEALLQENQFIKQFQPRYNIKLKDGGGYPYIKLTNAAYPTFSIVYKRTAGNDKYFGPYSSHHVARDILETVKKAFSLPDCNKEFPKDIGKGRPCLNYHIGRCCAPCVKGNLTSEDYRELINRASALLKGDGKRLITQLEEGMEIASEGLNFELAAKLRDCIYAVKKLNDRQQIVCSPSIEADVVGIYADDLGSALSLLFVRGGAIVDRENFFFSADEIINSAALVSFFQRYYELRGYIPKKIYIDYELESADSELITDWLCEKAGFKVSLVYPERGDMRAITTRASENAKQLMLHKRKSEDKKKDFLASIAKLLGLEVLPDRIESYDVSHSSGEYTSCGMIVLEHGVFAKRKYRGFNIHTVDDGNDLAALEECIRRRFSHDSDEAGWEYPDLMLIDGGENQVRRVKSVINEMGIYIPVFGMIKDEHHKTRTLTDGENEISLITRQDAFVFIYKIQEEVHRYSLSLMDAKRRNAVKKSSLTEIKGVGDKKANDLMLHFGTLSRLKTATKEELTEVKGITDQVAESIIEYFREEQNENNNRNSQRNQA
ncbi:MAG: excinuclease ABC subunit UvrC [Clostridia bacterium]|nr:excinuclease ABC subunit UvrC [Clostridia bacterium]